MAKSSTRKKSAKQFNPRVTQELGAVTDYIKRWTNRELSKLQTEHTPVCIPTSTGYRIGLYHLVVNPNKTCDVSDHNQGFIHRFDTKVSAVLYAIYHIKKRYWISDEILALDRVINKNYTDLLALRRSQEQARQQKDYITVDIRQARIDIAEADLALARDKIARIHLTAKLNKVWA